MPAAMKEDAEKLQSVTVVTSAHQAQARSKQLFHVYVLMVKKGRALEMLRSHGEKDDRNGYEAYQIVAAYEPKSATRSMGHLQKVPHPTFSAYLSARQENLLISEQDVERYARAADERLSESVLGAILTTGLLLAVKSRTCTFRRGRLDIEMWLRDELSRLSPSHESVESERSFADQTQ